MIRRKDLPPWEATKEIPQPDGTTIGIEPRHPFLYCPDCGEEYSANPGDYSQMASDAVFTCCGEEMRLVRKRTRYEDVEL